MFFCDYPILKKEKELLTATNKTVEEIAAETGFCTPIYFCKLFRRYEGITPTGFRKAE